MGQLILQYVVDEDPGILARDTRELSRLLNENIDGDAELRTVEGEDDSRSGSKSVLGEIVVSILSNETISSILGVLKAFGARKRGGKFSVTRPDGASISVEIDDLSDEQFEGTVDRLFTFTQSEVDGPV